MLIFPAVDVLGGRAVRLYQGDYNKQTVYDASPLAAAKRFEAAGAKYLHTVDLDGARSGMPKNAGHIRDIIANTALKVQVGGGIRDIEQIRKYLDMGAYRVILGTAALMDNKLLREAAALCLDRLAVAVDASNGRVAANGWERVTDERADEFILKLRDAGVQTVIYTDISRDGAMKGPNFEAYERLIALDAVDVVASGGITTYEDILRLKDMGAKGAILGRAVYEGAITIERALEIAGEGVC